MTETRATYAHGGPSEPMTCPACRQPVVRAEIRTIGGNFQSWHYEPVVPPAPVALDVLERAVVEATWRALLDYSQDPGNVPIDMTEWIAANHLTNATIRISPSRVVFEKHMQPPPGKAPP